MLDARELRGGRNLVGTDERKLSDNERSLAFQFRTGSERQGPPPPAVREDQEREESDAA